MSMTKIITLLSLCGVIAIISLSAPAQVRPSFTIDGTLQNAVSVLAHPVNYSQNRWYLKIWNRQRRCNESYEEMKQLYSDKGMLSLSATLTKRLQSDGSLKWMIEYKVFGDDQDEAILREPLTITDSGIQGTFVPATLKGEQNSMSIKGGFVAERCETTIMGRALEKNIVKTQSTVTLTIADQAYPLKGAYLVKGFGKGERRLKLTSDYYNCKDIAPTVDIDVSMTVGRWSKPLIAGNYAHENLIAGDDLKVELDQHNQLKISGSIKPPEYIKSGLGDQRTPIHISGTAQVHSCIE